MVHSMAPMFTVGSKIRDDNRDKVRSAKTFRLPYKLVRTKADY